MRTESASNADTAIWQRVIQFEGKLSPTAARTLLRVRFSQKDQQRMRELSAKARRGALDHQEQLEMDTYERLGCLLDILHSKARQALKKRRTAS